MTIPCRVKNFSTLMSLLTIWICFFAHNARAEIVNAAKRGIIDTAQKMADTKPEMKKLIPKCNKKCTNGACEKQRTKDCDKLEKLVKQNKADEEGIKQQANAGQQAGGIGEALKALAQMAPLFARGNSQPSTSFADDPGTAVAALTDIGESVGGFSAARRAVESAQLADQIEKSGILENASSGGEGAAGIASIGGGGGAAGALGAVSATDEIPIPGSEKEEDNTLLAEKSPGLTFGGGGGGGSGGSGGGYSMRDDPLLAMNEPPGGRKPASSLSKSDDEDHSLLNGEKIGTMYDNVFEKVSRRYQFLKKANRFILD